MFGVPTRFFRPAAAAACADGTDVALSASYAECQRLASAHYENFPVASWLLPRRMRPHVAAVYAFARQADDFADEGDRSAAERHRLLDEWLVRLRACTRGVVSDDSATSRLFLALGHTIESCDLPVQLFEDLVSAFRQDITTHRYQTWDDLLDYCGRSANPVGRLVLRIAGYRDEALDRASDCFCTALQLTNFWQDLEGDWRRGRLYVPADDLVGCGALERDLDARRWTPEWRRALGLAEARTRELFARGRPVCAGVGGRLRLELRMTWLGGVTVLDRLAATGFNVFDERPRLRRRDALRLLLRAARWQAS